MKANLFRLALAVSFIASTAHANNQEAMLRAAKIQKSIETCERKANVLVGAKAGALLISSTGAVLALAGFAGQFRPNGATGTEGAMLLGGAISSTAAPAAAGYISFAQDDFREYARLAGELGYDTDGVSAKAFMTNCLTNNGDELCVKSLNHLRAEAKAGTMCEWGLSYEHDSAK